MRLNGSWSFGIKKSLNPLVHFYPLNQMQLLQEMYLYLGPKLSKFFNFNLLCNKSMKVSSNTGAITFSRA